MDGAQVGGPTGQDKAAWRAWARAERASLPDVSADVTRVLAEFLRGWLAGRTLLAYRALPGEPDVSGLAAHFPLATTRARFRPQPHLTLHPWATATERSRFGAMQPPADAEVTPRDQIGAALLPGLAFDRSGVRLGYGGGFYDRLLSGWPGLLTVGVTPAALLLDRGSVGALPRDAHDLPVDFVATERGVWDVRRGEWTGPELR